ncbi:MAG: hypothetical protein WBO44_06925 [Saprospiraceae bacterium]
MKLSLKIVSLKFLIVCIIIIAVQELHSQDEINIDGSPCGMHGSARTGTKEYEQNPFKNRYTIPIKSDFDTRLQLKDFVNGEATEGKFLQTKAVEITGYIYDVKKGGVETCNCKTTDPLFRDTHIEITLNDQETGPENRFIIEVTPRIRQALADKGIDWTTEALSENIKGHMVKVQGWLFYDFSHKTENYADDPNNSIGRNNWRATSWEIHPVTSLEISDAMEPMVATDIQGSEDANMGMPINLNKPTSNNRSSFNSNNTMEANPLNILILIILGAILGMVGQGIRVIIGLKKVNDKALLVNKNPTDLIETQQLVLSLFIAFSIGAIAGVLASVNSIDMTFSKSMIVAFIGAGYAGTDFIEGFIKKNPASATSVNPPMNATLSVTNR